MTAIAFSLSETEAMIMVDTLVTWPQGQRPPIEGHKYYISPCGRLVIIPMGSLEAAIKWVEFVDSYLMNNDISSLMNNAQEKLSKIWSALPSTGGIFQVFMFHYEGQNVCCTGFASYKGFEPVCFKAYGLDSFYPFPFAPQRVSQNLNRERRGIEIIEEIKREDDLNDVQQRAGIGGHIDLIRGSNGSFTVQDDYYSFA